MVMGLKFKVTYKSIFETAFFSGRSILISSLLLKTIYVVVPL